MENSSQQGHPKGLWYLFGTEMWERFGYYLMLGIFSLYMIDGWNNGGMGFDAQKKSDIYGTYLGLVYLTPFIGGLLADRILGYRRSILIGGLMMSAGYFMLSVHSIATFYIALALIILGNGFFKPNISTLVGNLYSSDDMKDKKDAGYNIFYMGINIGAFVCNFVAAFMRINYGWGHAFAAAGVGMLVGVAIFLLGTKHIKHVDVVKPVQEGDMSTLKIFSYTVLPMFIFGVIGYILPGNFLGSDTNDAFIIGCLPVIAFFIYLAFTSEAKESRAIKALLAVFSCVILFFAIFHQNGDALTVWAEDHTNRNMSEGVANVADKMGMAQVVENSPIVQLEEKEFSSALLFFNNIGSTLPNNSKEELSDIKDFAGKLETIEKSRAYFKTLPKNEIPKLTLIENSVKLDSNLTKSKIKKINRKALYALFQTPENQLPLVLKRKSSYDLYLAKAKVVTDSLEREIKKDSKSSVSAQIKNSIDSISQQVILVSFVKDNLNEFKSDTNLSNLKLYSTELYQSINPFWVVTLTPVVVGFFGFMRRRKREPSTPTKIAIGLVITALSALVMVGAVFATNGMSLKASSMWLFASYGVITIGELCLSPMGLSLVSKLSPPRITALMMGGFFLAISVGNKLSGMLSSLWETIPQKENFFLLNFGLVMGAALLMFVMLKWLNQVMKENNVI